MAVTVAALYVDIDGAYYGVPGVDPWDVERDARAYPGPHPVVAHPPCQRWGRYWHGGPSAPHTQKMGDDGGCFAAALEAVRRWGGVLEHPADSHAWAAFGLVKPPRHGGWVKADSVGWTCCVYQGHYGHIAGKATWLYMVGLHPAEIPALTWGPTEQRVPPHLIAKYIREGLSPEAAYAKARRVGTVGAVGTKHKTRIRNATPPLFRDALLTIARATRWRG